MSALRPASRSQLVLAEDTPNGTINMMKEGIRRQMSDTLLAISRSN